MDDAHYMALAAEKARQGVLLGQHPYGAAVVRDGQLISCEHNLVVATSDPTAHAEIVALRRAALVLCSTNLSGCTVYCTCEPCVMCFGACYWAGATTIVYGADIDDKATFGLVDPGLRALTLKDGLSRPIVVKAKVGREACVDLFRQFLERKMQ
jgi:tRNA(Arg) A34 adenosine deaminase TadA